VKNNNVNFYDGKTITVVIDAGHGGDDNGAHSASGLKEKDITLSIAKKIAALNSNEHINILLSRDNDESIPVRDRVHFAKDHNADLFVSIHVNGAADEQLNGFSVVVHRNTLEKNQLLASALINELKTSYKTEDKITIRDKGLVVVDSNSCPAAIVECGYMTNPNDVAFISNTANQEKIAKNILAAINNYAASKENQDSKSTAFINDAESPVIKDTIPSRNHDKGIKGFTSNESKNEVYVEYTDGSKETITEEEALQKGIVFPPAQNALVIIDGKKSTKDQMKNIPSGNIESINVLKGEKAIKKYGEKGKDGAIEITTKFNIPENALVIIDGKKSSKLDLNNIPGDRIETINVLKGESAIKKYGEKGKDGAIEIITKKNMSVSSAKDTMPDKVFTKVEVEASFPGGLQAWTKYISEAIMDSIGRFTNRDYGTCVIRFIVNVDGKVSDVIATTMKGTELAKVSINAIKHGPKWIPASQNGKPVAAYRLQPVTLSNPQDKPAIKTESTKQNTTINTANDNQKIFVKLEQTASFPGGQPGWLKYISRVMQKNGNELIADKNSEGTCKVRFIVDRDGKVSDVRAVTKQGSKLADVAVNAIKNGPNWIPGRQNGHVVNSYLIQPVNFSLNDKMIKNEPL
jgi:N-acetylmuramoyl-L-alanine amidase